MAKSANNVGATFPVRLAAATRHWLEFQILCKREMLLCESYLTQPVGEFLKNEYNLPLQTERNHPNLNQRGRGRPRQIDYAILTRDKESIRVAIEAKWIGEQQLTVQRLVDDILRLECLRNEEGKVAIERYFLVAGKTQAISQKLLNRKKSKEAMSSVKSILPVNKDDNFTVNVRNCERTQRRVYQSFFDSYGVLLPTKFSVTMLENSVGDEIRVMIWKIEGTRGAGRFDPSSEWKEEISGLNDDESL